MKPKIIFMECSCCSSEHTFKMVYDKEENELYTEVYLNQYRSIFTRIWIAIKYICNYKCKYGHWDVFLFKTEDMKELKRLLKGIK